VIDGLEIIIVLRRRARGVYVLISARGFIFIDFISNACRGRPAHTYVFIYPMR
jgi:hypothetical protein